MSLLNSSSFLTVFASESRSRVRRPSIPGPQPTPKKMSQRKKVKQQIQPLDIPDVHGS